MAATITVANQGGVGETRTAMNLARGLRYLVVDAAPSAGGLQEIALSRYEVLVIPPAVDRLSLEGVAEMSKTLRSIGRTSLPIVRILPTFYDEVSRGGAVNLARLRGAFGAALLDPIQRAAVLKECPAVGRTIFEHVPESRAASEYARTVWECSTSAGEKDRRRDPLVGLGSGEPTEELGLVEVSAVLRQRTAGAGRARRPAPSERRRRSGRDAASGGFVRIARGNGQNDAQRASYGLGYGARSSGGRGWVYQVVETGQDHARQDPREREVGCESVA